MKPKTIQWIGIVVLGVLAFGWVCPAMNHPKKRQAQRIDAVNSVNSISITLTNTP